MSIDLTYWQRKPRLTIQQVSVLVFNQNPFDTEFVKQHQAEIEEICLPLTVQVKADLKKVRKLYHVAQLDEPIYFYKSLERNDFQALQHDLYPTVDTIELDIEEIKDWLIDRGIRAKFFSPGEKEIQLLDKSKHQTKLMNIMYQAIERYYGDNFDPEDKDSIPKQEHVVEWLMNEHALSVNQSKAIDIIIRPRT